MGISKKLFTPDAVTRYASGIPAGRLLHVYEDNRRGKDGRDIPFRSAVLLIDSVKSDVKDWYKKETKKDFNPYELGEFIGHVRERFWHDPRFIEAFTSMGLPERHIRKAFIPWWNEIAGTELHHTLTDDGALILLGPRHSLETQLVRAGVKLPIRSVSVGGIIETSDGFIAIGLRGGASYSNTYHITAGALGMTSEIKSGESSVYGFFNRSELLPEFGISPDKISAATIHARIFDASIEHGPIYVFLIKVSLTFDEVNALYGRNKDQDKGEHTRLVAIQANADAVMEFIRQNYRGMVANKDGREDNERYLLHPGALALLSYTQYSISELEKLYKPGIW